MHQEIPLNNCILRYVLGSNDLLEITNERIDQNVVHTLEVAELNKHYIYSVVKLVLPNDVHIAERGIGKIIKKDEKHYLSRIRPTSIYHSGKVHTPNVHTSPTNMMCVDDQVISASIDPPANINELLAFPYTVIYSNARGFLESVSLDNNCTLVRRNDDIISVPVDELKQAPTYNSTEEAPKHQGLIIYDNSSDCLKYYSGKGWRKI
jgi:hypothetical protein